MKALMSLLCFLVLGTLSLTLGSCGAPPHQDAPRIPTEVRGKSQAWFEENWGKPSAKSKQFFGGETWVYFRLTGGIASLPLFETLPAECQIRLDFNKEGTLEDSDYSGC